MPILHGVPRILTPQQLVELYPAIKLRTLRYWIQHAEGKRREVPGNGLAPALIRKGRITLIDEDAFRKWLEDGRRAERLNARNIHSPSDAPGTRA
jgi:hypothetical protein